MTVTWGDSFCHRSDTVVRFEDDKLLPPQQPQQRVPCSAAWGEVLGVTAASLVPAQPTGEPEVGQEPPSLPFRVKDQAERAGGGGWTPTSQRC